MSHVDTSSLPSQVSVGTSLESSRSQDTTPGGSRLTVRILLWVGEGGRKYSRRKGKVSKRRRRRTRTRRRKIKDMSDEEDKN